MQAETEAMIEWSRTDGREGAAGARPAGTARGAAAAPAAATRAAGGLAATAAPGATRAAGGPTAGLAAGRAGLGHIDRAGGPDDPGHVGPAARAACIAAPAAARSPASF